MKKKKTANDLPFLVIIRAEPENLLFGFPTQKQREGFLKGLKEKWGDVDYLTSEVPGTKEERE